ncbi:MAG: arginine deiminase family protein [archaeon]
MGLNVIDEYSTLKKVIVAKGTFLPEYGNYSTNQIEYAKYHTEKWDKKLLLEQQTPFFNLLKKYSVELLFPDTDKSLIWQMYTRDTGFVYGNRFFYCNNRGLIERKDEIKKILSLLKDINPENIIEITAGKLEGGDVLVDRDIVYVGISSRSSIEGAANLERNIKIKRLYLGNSVMHLDTRMTILPKNCLLIYPGAFQKEDLDYLSKKFNFLNVTEKEAQELGTNVLVINPKTVIVNKSHIRIQDELRKIGFNVEVIDYSEPIALSGSFRCTTLPLERQ